MLLRSMVVGRARLLLVILSCCSVLWGCASVEDNSPRRQAVEWADLPEESVAVCRINGREVLRYQYHRRWALPHIWPLISPSGKSMLVQKTSPFPHHRSLWLADKLRLADGPVIDYYHEWKNLIDPKRPELGHHSYIRHDALSIQTNGPQCSLASTDSTWIARGEPVMKQICTYAVSDLGHREYSLHMKWEWIAAYGDIHFHSDWVHYGWPFIRMSKAFCGTSGGTIVSDTGARGQADTNKKVAKWIDYSNTVDGVSEGLAVFVPDDGRPRRWLTREYGTFGPRRPKLFDGTKFVLKEGEVLQGEVEIVVHRGNAKTARIGHRN